jgi:integrase/recombinase XerD
MTQRRGKPRRPERPKPPVGDVRDPDSLYHHMLRFLAFLETKGYSAHTVRGRDVALRTFIKWCDERSLMRPQQLDRPIMERYQRHLFYRRKANGEPLTARSQQHLLIPIRLWLQWLVKQGHLLYNAAADLELPRVGRRLPKAILTAAEAEAVLAVPNVSTPIGLRDRAILETLYSTGMRRMELVSLSVYEVDRERGTVMIREGKGKKDRLIPIGERALAWIAAYRDHARPEMVGPKDDGTLFLTHMGEPLQPGFLTHLVKEIITKAAIGKEGACHLFRHTMATLMLENGADTRYIQAMLGHASLETTQVYTLVSIRKLKAIHTATHPGKMPEAVRKRLEEEAEPSAEELLAQLDQEAEEEA